MESSTYLQHVGGAFSYQRRLERRANAKMALLMLIATLVFWFAPNPRAFALLNDNGLPLTPNMVSGLCLLGAFVYLWRRFDPSSERLLRPTRRILFAAGSIGILIYVFPIALIAATMGSWVTALSNLLLYGVVLSLCFAIYDGYSRRLELAITGILVTIFLLSAGAFLQATPAVLRAFHISPVLLALLCLVSGLGYLVLLHPAAAHLSRRVRQLGFMALASPLTIYGTIQLMAFLLLGTGSLIVPLVLIHLHLLICLFPYSLYRPEP